MVVQGLYIMEIASMLTGMHPQTLRKYERAGLIKPQRNNSRRMYSDEDIGRLKYIRFLSEELGLNLAGIKLVLELREFLDDLKKEIEFLNLDRSVRERLDALLNNILKSITEEKPG